MNLPIIVNKTDHGGEFDQDKFIDYCCKNDISHNFSVPRAM